MQSRRSAVTFLAATLMIGGIAAAQPSRGAPSIPSTQALARQGLQLSWWGQGVLNPSRDKVQQLSSDEDCVYVQSNGGIITAFDALTGQRRWSVQLGRFDDYSFQAVSNEDVVLVVVGTDMYGLDKISGNTLWSLRLPGQPSTSPAADETQVYLGMLDGSVYAYDLAKIRELFYEGKLPDWSFQAIKWRFQASKEITSPPVVIGTRVCFASRDGNVYAVSADRRKMVFQFETDAPIVAPLAHVEDILYLASEDFSFYALRVKPKLQDPSGKKQAGEGAYREDISPLKDRESGKVLWEFTSGRPIRKSPFPIGPDIYLMPDRGGFFCFNSQTGDKKWWQPQGADFVAASAQKVYVSDREDNLLILSRANGGIIGSLPLRQFPVRFANDRTDRIVMATKGGLVMMLQEIGHSIPRYHMHPERLPILPEFASEEGDAEEKPADEKSGDENPSGEKEDKNPFGEN